MKIHLEKSGGFLGLKKHFKVDLSKLSEEIASEIREHVKALDFFKMPGKIAVKKEKKQMDNFVYSLTVEENNLKHTVNFAAEAMSPELSRLVARIMETRDSNKFGIIPPHIVEGILKNGTSAQRAWAENILMPSDFVRVQRQNLFEIVIPKALLRERQKSRIIYTAENKPRIPGKIIREEGEGPVKDIAANEAYDYLGCTYDFYFEILKRRSIDDADLPLEATVNFRENPREGYSNAFWDGERMIFGNGDDHLPKKERLFNRFTIDLDVIGHELTHGMVQFEIQLNYEDQAGALHESFADVFGSMIKQWKAGEKAIDADWLVGENLFTKNVKAKAIRSLKAPGTAYDDPVLGGKDPQPSHMRDYLDTDSDNGGVHINSGIPNHAFYLAAAGFDGYSWEKTGKIWYEALKELKPKGTFSEFARHTIKVSDAKEKAVIKNAWEKVGVKV